MTDEYIKLGLEQLHCGNPQAALRHFEAAYALQPDNSEVLFYLGRTYSDLNKDNEAVRYYRLSLQIEPDSAATWLNMANCYDRLKQAEEAEEAYRTASNLDPDNDEVYLGWGIFYYNQERYEAALACYEQALRLNPDNGIALQNQCDSLVMMSIMRRPPKWQRASPNAIPTVGRRGMTKPGAANNWISMARSSLPRRK